MTDDGGAVLIVVENGDIAAFLQLLLDLKAAGRGNILQIDAAEASRRASDTVFTMSSTSLERMHRGMASTSPNALNSTHLPSITGMPASGPMSPRPSTAVPSVTTATGVPAAGQAHSFC